MLQHMCCIPHLCHILSTASCEMNCLINGEIFYTFKEAQITTGLILAIYKEAQITTGLILEMYIDRAMEERVQHCSAAQLARLQTACTRNYCFELQRKNKKRRYDPLWLLRSHIFGVLAHFLHIIFI